MKTTLLCLLFFSIVVSKPASLYSQAANIQDSLALVEFYNSTNGSSWNNRLKWLTPAPLPSWYGVMVTNGRVTNLNLDNNNVNGSLPFSIGNLSNLIVLSLFNNQVSGVLPTSIGDLQKLETLGLNINQITGSIPSSVGNLTKLSSFLIAGNQLTGTIPASIGNLTLLSAIQLSHNQLTGEIPGSLGNLDKLWSLELSNNQLSGTIPSSFAGLTNLHNFFLGDNQLSGYVPAFLGNLPLNSFTLQNNQFVFDGLELIEQYYGSKVFYAPQANLTIHRQADLLSVYAGGTLSNNTYKWYKNGELVETKTGDSTFMINGAGDYYATIKNAVATQLTLVSNIYSNNSLPLLLLDFRAVAINNHFLLNWLTTNEQNTKSFEIQRSSDAINFTTIHIETAMNKPGNHPYTFMDNDLQPGNYYYRLMMRDNDGKISYSKNIAAQIKRSNISFSVYPNPAVSMATLIFDAFNSGCYTIELSDVSGRKINRIKGSYSVGSNKVILNLNELPKGIYLLTLINDTREMRSIKLIKQ